MRKIIAFLLALAAPMAAQAQPSPGQPLVKSRNLSDLLSVPTARTNLGLGTAALLNTGTSGANVPLLNGANTWGANQVIPTLNGWTASLVTRPDTVTSPTAGGSGYALGDLLTLQAGCSVNPVVVVGALGASNAVTTTAVSGTSLGSGCPVTPANPVATTGGTGTGATFSPSWVPDSAVNHFASNAASPGGTMVLGNGAGLNMKNTALGPTAYGFGSAGGGQQMELGVGGTGMTGAENTLFGGFTGTQVTTGNFLLCAGWNACGHESDGSASTYLNTDAGKYAIHNVNTTALGSNVFKFVWNATQIGGVGENIAQGQFAQQTSSQVTGVGAGTGGVVRVTMTSTTGMTSGDMVFAAQFTSCAECNGQWFINVIDSTHIDLLGTTFATGSGTGWITDLPTGVLNVPVVGAISGNAGVVRLKVRDTFNISTAASGLTVRISNVGGTTEANGTYTGVTVIDADCGIANGTGCGVELPGTTFTNAWTSGGTLSIVKGPSNMFLAGYHALSSTTLSADNTNIVAITPGGLGGWKGGSKSIFIGPSIAATTCGSAFGNTVLILLGVDTSSDCATTTTFQAIGIGQDMKLVTQSNIIGIGNAHVATTGAGQLQIIGRNVFRAATTIHNSIGIGDTVGQTTCGTNSNIILVGNTSTVDCPTSSINNWLNVGGIRASIQAPVIGSGFGTSPSIAAGGTTSAFTVNVGTGGVATTGSITVQAAPTGWACSASDRTNPDTSNTVAFSTSTTAISLKNYNRTTGVALAWAASDVIEVACWGY